MSQANLQNEPTMDEILASIRKIISEDQPEIVEAKAAEPPPAPEPQPVAEMAAAPEPELPPEPANEEDILDVSALAAEMAADEPSDLPPVVEQELDLVSEEVETFISEAVASEIAAPGGFAHHEADFVEEYIVETPAEEGLISETARGALDHAFDQLDAEEVSVRPAAPEGGSVEAVFARAVQQALEPTLQDWVEDHREEIVHQLAPLIRAWMDENLPPLIEAAVAREIARAVRARRR